MQLVANEDGHLTGTASIHWVSASSSASVAGLRCTATETFGADGEVNINGDISDDGVLTLTFLFDEALGTLVTACAGHANPGGAFPYLIAQTTIKIKTSGGVVKQGITYGDNKFPGRANIVVKPVKGT